MGTLPWLAAFWRLAGMTAAAARAGGAPLLMRRDGFLSWAVSTISGSFLVLEFGDSVDDALRQLVGVGIEALHLGLVDRPPLIRSVPVGRPVRQLAVEHGIASLAQILARSVGLRLRPRSEQGEANPLGGDCLHQFVRQQHGRAHVVLARSGRQNHKVAVLSDFLRGTGRVGCAVDDEHVVPLGGVERASDGTEALDCDFRLYAGLDAVAMPVKGGTLANVEIGNFDVPSISRKGTGDKPADGALAGTALLGNDSN